MAPLFVYRSLSLSLVSGRLHLIVQALRCAGRSVTPDAAALAANPYSDTVFWGQISTYQTVVSGVRMLAVGESIEIGRSSIKIIGPDREPADPLDEAAYHALIQRGAEDIAANVTAAIDSRAFGRKILTLSGGRDSRAVLAALVATDRLKDVVIVTEPLPGDAAIASGLVRHFGGRFDTEPPEAVEWCSTPEAVERRRSLSYGLYHDWNRLRIGMPVYAERPLRLMGGCGEITALTATALPRHSWRGAMDRAG